MSGLQSATNQDLPMNHVIKKPVIKTKSIIVNNRYSAKAGTKEVQKDNGRNNNEYLLTQN
jgi:hypothetical protein